MLVLFWMVFVSLVVSYAKIALKLQRISKEKPDLPNAARYKRTARKSFFILFLFTVCFVPYHIVRVFYIKTQITDTACIWRGVADKANEVALLFSALNSCLDPVMYFLLSSSVRREVLRLVSSVFCVRDANGVSGSSSTVENVRSERGQANINLSSQLKEATTQ
ncbi:putative G-protein coupled receptor 34 [Dissostichus eleginoides]|uniref:G-protein coupled receptor 34 n=2 Tax=Dissostichus eleginoides TaxID=100907 RepID=A0AAD9CI16_DISEL|nr:putative G-protein coupled receptor 34 [Dissostichus eleginoides]